ncbi:MAG: hypothetical protein JOZ62_08305 [Acidobacteriaceae bacterium]|nr:hypothetical protein [Acidobacteriaceae bacterium]
MNRRKFMQSAAAAITAPAGMKAQVPDSQLQNFIHTAESLKPRLSETIVNPVSLVWPRPDPSTFLKWRMDILGPATVLRERVWRAGDTFILDFGRHLTGHLVFSVSGVGAYIDAPVRLKLTFGEVPPDVAIPLETYSGTLSRAWLPDEIINVDFLPQHVRMPRRYAFRYVKIEVIDTAPPFSARFDEIHAVALTSAAAPPPALETRVPELLRDIDRVSLNTLRDCMQTVFEDGPRRDRRLWIGDLRLQALTNYVSFRNYELVKRCLYLFAGLPREDGLVAACVYEKPTPLCGRQYIMDYAALYGSVVLDYVRATGSNDVARELWRVVKRQMDILGQFVNDSGLFVDPGGWWIFIDWRDELDRTAAMHGVLLFAYRQALDLARLAGRQNDAASYPERIRRMTAAARESFYDKDRGVFVSGPHRQVSWATQAWMIHAGIATTAEGKTALERATNMPDAIRPGTPYLYHYVTDAMLLCDMKKEANDLVTSYWGGMVKAGADTFWEIYDPSNPTLSPYKSVLVNSYCHAWSCTPAYLIRSGKLLP